MTPVLIFVFFFPVFEYSRYFYNQQVVEVGIRDAVRYLARGPYFSAVVSEGTNPCVDSTNTQNAQNLAVTGTVDGSGTVRVAGWAPGNVKFKCDNIPNPGTYAGPNPIWLVTVYTKFADPALGFFGLLGVGIPNLSASHTERSFGSG